MSDPETPVTVTVAAPVVAEEEAVSVRVEVALPFAFGVTGLAEKLAVTPLGRPVALNVVAELKLFWLVMVIVLVPLLPRTIVSEAGEVARVKLGAGIVRASVVVAVSEPKVPLMVIVAVPTVAELLAVNLRTLLPVVGLVAKDAVTPEGRPEAASVTLPVNPFWPETLMVDVPEAPLATVREVGEALRVKAGAGFTVSVTLAVAVV